MAKKKKLLPETKDAGNMAIELLAASRDLEASDDPILLHQYWATLTEAERQLSVVVLCGLVNALINLQNIPPERLNQWIRTGFQLPGGST